MEILVDILRHDNLITQPLHIKGFIEVKECKTINIPI